MGTRADYYIGKGESAEWLGSTALDGYPDGKPVGIVAAKTEEEFRSAVAALSGESDWSGPSDGWPWPWDDSCTTDFAYGWSDGAVWVARFGRPWAGGDDYDDNAPEMPFPDMSKRKNVQLGNKRSGMLLIRM